MPFCATFAGTFRLAGDPASSPYQYGRYGNPTWTDFENALGELEHGRVVVFCAKTSASATDRCARRLLLMSARRVAASMDLVQSRTLSALRPDEYRTGVIYTTAALFAEGMEDVERWFKDGFAAVDMETAATYAIAEHFGMERLSILFGFDNPRRREHILVSDNEKDLRRAVANDRVRQLALDLAVEICEKAGAKTASLSIGPRIRDCRPEEIEAVLTLWKDAETTISATDSAANLRLAIPDSSAIVLVAERDGRIVGSVIGGFDGWRGNIYRLAVHPACRRQGIARILVAEIERRFAAQGTNCVTALVLNDHPWAMGFWQAVGYEVDHRMARLFRNLGKG